MAVPARAATLASTFVVALLVVVACPSSFPPSSLPCQPDGPEPRCGGELEGYLCCSDDPAALDLAKLDGDALPDYAGGTGTPLFSAARNDASHFGTCVSAGAVPPLAALSEGSAAGCPKPCNPQWDAADRAAACGSDSLCCQSVEITAADCVLDSSIGDAGCWKPARGDDIVGLGGLEASAWASTSTRPIKTPARSAVRASSPGSNPPTSTPRA